MGKSAASAKKSNPRSERVARVNSKRPASAPANDINAMVARWKKAHIAEVRAKAENEAARGEVKDKLITDGVNHAITPTGTVALQERSGATKIDWEALARKYLESDAIEAALPEFTTVGEASVVLAAPKEWAIEAKSGR